MRTYPGVNHYYFFIKHVVLTLGLSALFACHSDDASWATKDISGLMPALHFTLTEANRDITVHARDFHGKVVLLYFGYTHCPDVCPMTLERIKMALTKLGKEAGEVRVLFVSVDPKRDNVDVLRRYTEFFGPQVLGMRGSNTALRNLTKMYRVTYGYDKPDAKGNYAVSHSSAVYVFDRHGEPRLLLRPDDKTAAITADLHQLLAES
jgi:protein SCO1/2